MYCVRDDYRLQTLERTGYADGGMSAREERLYERSLQEEESLRAAEREREEMVGFLEQAEILGETHKENILAVYDQVILARRTDLEYTQLALRGWAG